MLNSKGSAIMALLPINSVLQIELSGKGEWMVTVKKFQAQFLSPEKVIMWLAKAWWAGRGGFALFVCCSPLAIHRANFCLWFWGSRKKCLCSLEIIEQFWHCCCNQINILSRFVSIVPVQGKCKISPCSFLHPSACPSMLLCGMRGAFCKICSQHSKCRPWSFNALPSTFSSCKENICFFSFLTAFLCSSEHRKVHLPDSPCSSKKRTTGLTTFPDTAVITLKLKQISLRQTRSESIFHSFLLLPGYKLAGLAL